MSRPEPPRPTSWRGIVRAWIISGHFLPKPGSPAWRALPPDDLVRLAAAAAERAGVRRLIISHGPTYARLFGRRGDGSDGADADE